MAVRQQVHEGATLPNEISSTDIADDRYLKPVLDDDALILCLDDLPRSSEDASPRRFDNSDHAIQDSAPDSSSLLIENSQLREKLELLSKQFQSYREAVQETLDQRWGEDEAEGTHAQQTDKIQVKKQRDDSDYYFESYAHNGTLMLTSCCGPR